MKLQAKSRLRAAYMDKELISDFLKQSKKTKFYSVRDNCGPACLDLIDYAKSKGIDLTRIEGEFTADQVVYDKADFTSEMKKEFKSSGKDFNSPEDRKSWIKNSKYAEEWTKIPHYWCKDISGNIYDPTVELQFIKTGLSKDLSDSRYKATRVEAVFIDKENGLGQVPNNINVDYMGLSVLMKPSVFLKLAAPLHLTSKGKENIQYMVGLIKSNEPIAPPFFQLDIPESWEKGLTETPARVVGHEGRHRMLAIMEAEGDHPIEVHLFPLYYRRRNITEQWITSLNYKLIPEGKDTPTKGPFFTVLK